MNKAVIRCTGISFVPLTAHSMEVERFTVSFTHLPTMNKISSFLYLYLLLATLARTDNIVVFVKFLLFC